MTQLTLFPSSPSQRPAVGPARGLPVHATDPDPSRRAAHRHEMKAESNRMRLLRVLKQNPGCSTETLNRYMDCGITETRRRMTDLKKRGEAEIRSDADGHIIEGINGVAWWPTGKATE